MFRRLRNLMVSCILLSLVGAVKAPEAFLSNHEVKMKTQESGNRTFQKVVEDSECDDIIDRYEFYRFNQQDMQYLVADTFSDRNSSYLLVRVILTPESYYYSGSELINADEIVMEVQSVRDSVFFKKFYSLTPSAISRLMNKAKNVDGSNLHGTFVSAFHQEFNELTVAENSPKRMPKLLKNDLSKTNNDAALDTYLACRNNMQKIRLDDRLYPTFDDPIVSLLERDFFTSSGEKSYTGLEWGYYVNTQYLDDGNYSSEVFVYDIDTYRADTTSFNGMRIVPVVNATYLYNYKMDMVMYISDSNLAIVNPRYTSVIRYFDIYEPYEDGDDVYYDLVGEHVPNIGDADYSEETDYGACFVDDGLVLRGQFQNSVKNTEKVGPLISVIGKMASIIIDSLDLSLKYSFLAGMILDTIEIITQKYFEENVDDNSLLVSPVVDTEYKNKYIYEKAFISDDSDFYPKRPKIIDRCITNPPETHPLMFKDSKDDIRYFSKLAWSHDERSKDVNIMISNRISFDIYNDTSGIDGKIRFLKNVVKNITYRCPKNNQSRDVRFTSNLNPWTPSHVSLDDSSKNYEIDFNCTISGKYRFYFYDFSANFKISLNNRLIFDSDEREIKEKLSNVLTLSRHVPVTDEFEYILNAERGLKYQFQITRKSAVKFLPGFFSYTIMMLGTSISTETFSNKHGENYLARNFASPGQTLSLSFVPKTSGVYTIATQCNDDYIFFITDEFGNPLCDNRFYYTHSRCITDVYLAAGKKYYLHFGDSYNEQKNIRFELYYVSYCPGLNWTLNKKVRYPSYDNNYICFMIYNSFSRNVTAEIVEGNGKASVKVFNLESGMQVADGSSSTSFYIQSNTHYLIKINVSQLNDVQKSIVSLRLH